MEWGRFFPTLVSTTSIESEPPTSENSLPDRFISAFRGRTIHGLSVDVPKGFTGVVLRSEGATAEQKLKKSALKAKQQRPNREKFKGATGEVMDTPCRTMRQSSRKMVAEDLMDVDDESEDEDETGNMAEDEEAEDSTQPKLAPASQFSSFILWHPVIPVEAGKDEYNEAILERMKICQLVRSLSGTFFMTRSDMAELTHRFVMISIPGQYRAETSWYRLLRSTSMARQVECLRRRQNTSYISSPLYK
ncbi:hypothetical protein PQX77_011647 [Marasmius sp. AFHP31]|nr:hypothetical protein PQX77_011647 [Marasmius sp. AFHP31]